MRSSKVGRGDSSTDTASEGEPEEQKAEQTVKKAKHKLKLPSGRITNKKQQKEDNKLFHLPTDIKVEAEITGSLLSDSVAIVSLVKTSPTGKSALDQNPGAHLPDNETKLPGSETSPEDKLSAQNDGKESLGSNVAEEKNSEGKKPEGSISEGDSAESKLAGAEGSNAGETSEPCKGTGVEIKMDVDSIPSTSGLQDCATSKIVPSNLTEKEGSSTNEDVISKVVKTGVTTNTNVTSPVYFERKATLFNEGSVKAYSHGQFL